MKGRMTNTMKTNQKSHGYASGGAVNYKALHHGSKSKILGASYEKGGSKNVEKEAHGKTSVPFTKNAKVPGIHPTPRLDRPGRQRGGRCGADMTPLSSASKVSNTEDG